MSLADRIHFSLMSLVHGTLYGLFRDPYKALGAAGLQPGQTVLEVGCGPGFFTIPAAQIVEEQGSVCALDINPLAIQKVRGKIEQAGVDNVRLHLADAAETGLPAHSFDLIFVFGFEHYRGDSKKLQAELYRLLKPKGTLAVEGPARLYMGLFESVGYQEGITRLKKAGQARQKAA